MTDPPCVQRGGWESRAEIKTVITSVEGNGGAGISTVKHQCCHFQLTHHRAYGRIPGTAISRRTKTRYHSVGVLDGVRTHTSLEDPVPRAGSLPTRTKYTRGRRMETPGEHTQNI